MFYQKYTFYIITFTLFVRQRTVLLNKTKINTLKLMIRKIYHAEVRQNEKTKKFDFLHKSMVVLNTAINV